MYDCSDGVGFCGITIFDFSVFCLFPLTPYLLPPFLSIMSFVFYIALFMSHLH